MNNYEALKLTKPTSPKLVESLLVSLPNPVIGTVAQTDIDLLTPILKRLKPIWPLLRPILTYESKLLSATERISHIAKHR